MDLCIDNRKPMSSSRHNRPRNEIVVRKGEDDSELPAYLCKDHSTISTPKIYAEDNAAPRLSEESLNPG